MRGQPGGIPPAGFLVSFGRAKVSRAVIMANDCGNQIQVTH